MKLTKNFYLHEFDCKDGNQVPHSLIPNVQLLAEQLQIVRDVVREPIFINSAWRHTEYNKAVGGSKFSQHLLAKAADITIGSMTPDDVWLLLNNMMIEGYIINGGLGKYNSFNHYDVREDSARWDYSRK
jgi:uncharacterized protein YcbK (DUF882 family)